MPTWNLILTDGEVNEGITNPEEFEKIFKSFGDLSTIIALGVGPDYDRKILQVVRGLGTMEDAPNAETIIDVLGGMLSELRHVVGMNAKISHQLPRAKTLAGTEKMGPLFGGRTMNLVFLMDDKEIKDCSLKTALSYIRANNTSQLNELEAEFDVASSALPSEIVEIIYQTRAANLIEEILISTVKKKRLTEIETELSLWPEPEGSPKEGNLSLLKNKVKDAILKAREGKISERDKQEASSYSINSSSQRGQSGSFASEASTPYSSQLRTASQNPSTK